MKKRSKLSPGQCFLAALLLVIFTVFSLFLFSYKREEKLFLQRTQLLFEKEMCRNTLNMHYSIADPGAFGIRSYQVSLPCYRQDPQDRSIQELEEEISFYKGISEEGLTPEECYAKDILIKTLINSLQQSQFPYYSQPLSPTNGMQTQLPILLAEYTFRNEKDVSDYLKLLGQTGDYYDSLLLYEQDKAAAGLLPVADTLRKSAEQCRQLMNADQLNGGVHFLQTTFRERIDLLVSQHVISEKTAQKACTINDQMLWEVMLPAYLRLGDGLDALALNISNDSSGTGAKSSAPAGLCTLPKGREYFEVLLFSQTGSSLSPKEIKLLLTARLAQELSRSDQLAQEIRCHNSDTTSGNLSALRAFCETSFPLTTAEEMLADLQYRMRKDFPLLIPLPKVQVKAVSPCLEPYSAPAFYLTPPMDDTEHNVIYINERSTPKGLELYTTLAHEGYPGHLFQSVYSNRLFLNSDTGRARSLIWYGGYTEGWAMYAEFLAYDYAADLMKEKGYPEAASYIIYEKHCRSSLLCLYALCDLMIHYNGAGEPQIAMVLDAFGIKDPSTAHDIYDYITDSPANYLKYYLGYLEVLSLKENAQKLLGTDYSDLKFHTFYLEMGPADFDSLHAQLGQYAENR